MEQKHTHSQLYMYEYGIVSTSAKEENQIDKAGEYGVTGRDRFGWPEAYFIRIAI